MRIAAVMLVFAVGDALAAGPDTAIVSLADGDTDAGPAIGRLRAELATSGAALVPPGLLRDALEEPLTPQPAVDLSGGRALFEAAIAAFKAFELSAARAQLGKMDAAIGAQAIDLGARQLMADRFLLSGQIELQAGKQEAAADAFQLAYRLWPQRNALDPGQYRPSVVSAFADAAAASNRGHKVSVSVSVSPDDATVYVDGVSKARTLDLAQGWHWVIVTRPGYEPSARAVDVRGPGEVGSFKLAALPAVERIRELRRHALSAPGDADAHAAELCEIAGVEVLVAVRGGALGLESATYRRSEGTWSEFRPIGTAVSRHAPMGAGRTKPPIESIGGRKERAWYGQWWGVGLIAATGAVATAAVLYLFLGGDSDDVRIERWCFDTQC